MEFKMADCKPEVEITFEYKEMAKRFQRLPHIFYHPQLDMALPTRFYISRHQEPKMSAMKLELEITFEWKEMAKRFQWLPHIFYQCLRFLGRHFWFPM